jgi:hypothetical protein
MKLVLLGRLFGECRNLFFGMSLIPRKRHPFANDFSARFVVLHIRGSLAYLIWDSSPRLLTPDEVLRIATDETGASTLTQIDRVLVRIASAAAQCRAKWAIS